MQPQTMLVNPVQYYGPQASFVPYAVPIYAVSASKVFPPMGVYLHKPTPLMFPMVVQSSFQNCAPLPLSECDGSKAAQAAAAGAHHPCESSLPPFELTATSSAISSIDSEATPASSCAASDVSIEEQHKPGETKQELIHEVREKLDCLLSRHFPHRTEGKVTNNYAHEMNHEPELLRGDSVGNIRAKSIRSLNALVGFVSEILAPNGPHQVSRVDVIIQKKKRSHLKGLLVNIQFSSQKDLLHVRDAIWKGQGYDESLPKFMPAVFAQDCSWRGLPPKNLSVVETAFGDLRVQSPLPKKLQALGLDAGCRIKSMSVTWKPSMRRKVKTVEVPKNQLLRVLTEGKCTVKGVEHALDNRTSLTVSFEEDWKTNFWRSSGSESSDKLL